MSGAMDWDIYVRAMLALVVVLALIAGVAWTARRFGLGGVAVRGGRHRRRLGVVESMALDGRRRLVLVRRDDREHLLLIGGAADLVVERAIGDDEEPADLPAVLREDPKR